MKTPDSPTSRSIPHSPAAERSMLGAALLTDDARLILAKELDPSDFYEPRNGHIANAISEMHRIGAGIDPTTVATWLHAHGLLEAVGGHKLLVEIMSEAPSSRNAGTYARTVREHAVRRRFLRMLDEASKMNYNLSIDPADTADWTRTEISKLDIPGAEDEGPSLNVDEFLAMPREYDWIVPGLLERGDRMLLTAAEGLGKSTYLRQLGVQFSAGVHPGRPRHPFPPIKVLLIDLENSEMQIARKLQRMMTLVRPEHHQAALGDGIGYNPDNLRINVRNQGIDLSRRDDRRWFTSRIEQNRPDVVITGPIYKMSRGNPNDEAPAAELSGYLDELRIAYGCALLLEAHSPHGTDGGHQRTLRPIGASLWRRWPEFGAGIREDGGTDGGYDWEWWRPPRDDDREWPRKLRRSNASWPWVPYHGPTDDQLQNPPANVASYMREVPNQPDIDEPF